MKEVYEIEEVLDLNLDRDRPTANGYFVENWKGLDVAVLAYPKGTQWAGGGANPAYIRYLNKDPEYEGQILFSPLPIDREDVLKIEDEVIDLETREELPERVEDLIKNRGGLESLINIVEELLTGGLKYSGEISEERKNFWKKYWKKTAPILCEE